MSAAGGPVGGARRRTVLVAAAGLAVGAGGTGLGSALGGGAAPAYRPAPPMPGEQLMTEHGVLKRVLLAYRAIGARLSDGRAVEPGLLLDAAQLVADFVEGFHEGLEEAYVFPRVAAQHGELVRTLLVQHDRGRHLTAATLAAAGGDLRASRTRAAVAADLAAFVRMYEPHEAWEDTVVYPALRRVTPQRTLDLLAERFAELENRRYGDDALARMLDRVGGIEAQLGIGELAAFTPPAPG